MRITNITEIEKLKQDFNSQGYCKLLGIQVIDLKKGRARLSLRFNQNQLNKEGVLHGGVISSLADSAAAVSLLSIVEPGRKIAAIELNINFLRPVKNGELFADAKIIHKGSRTAVGDVEIKNKQELVAKCLVTFMILEGKTHNVEK